MNTDDTDAIAVAWANVAEPGDLWAAALRSGLGAAEALRWAQSPYAPPPPEVIPPGAVRGRGAEAGWKAAHRRWQPRFEDLDVSRDIAQLHALGGRLVTPDSAEWPEQLDDLELRKPPALWVLGHSPLTCEQEPAVSIVGARAATSYGVRVTSQIAFELTEAGVCVVSGGAYGIDAAAHRGALDAADVAAPPSDEEDVGCLPPRTIAIICGGLANLYPAGNERLFQRILDEGGSIVAEVPPRFRPARWRFLERNRLIAAWSDLTVVPEATLRSGALATSNRALELGRDVAAVPGPVTSQASKGPHALIKDGAALVTSARDIIEVLVGVEPTGEEGGTAATSAPDAVAPTLWVETQLSGLGPLARRVYEALPAVASTTVANVARSAGLSVADTGGALLSLRFADLVRHDEGRWARAA